MEALEHLAALTAIMERQTELNAKIAEAMDASDRLDDLRAEQIRTLGAEVVDLREGLVALSNRIEALTQAGLHSVKA